MRRESILVRLRDQNPVDWQRRITEGRANAISKSVYVRTILLHCRECFGVVPVRHDCGGEKLRDGTACNLYQFSTAKKCRAGRKRAMRSAIIRELRVLRRTGRDAREMRPAKFDSQKQVVRVAGRNAPRETELNYLLTATGNTEGNHD